MISVTGGVLTSPTGVRTRKRWPSDCGTTMPRALKSKRSATVRQAQGHAYFPFLYRLVPPNGRLALSRGTRQTDAVWIKNFQ